MGQTESGTIKKRKVNILYISNHKDFIGGAEKSICDIIGHLDREKYNPYYVSIHDGEIASFIKNKLGVSYKKLNEFKRRNPFPYIISQIQLIYLLLRNRIDIIHNNQCHEAFYTWLPAFLTNTKLIIHHRDSSVLSRMDHFFINHADCNISVSSWVNDQFLKGKAVVINNGIDLTGIDSYVAGNSVETINSAKKRLSVGLVGRIAPIKGQHLFVEAAKTVLENYSNVQFYMYGDWESGLYNNYYLELKKTIAEMGISDCVIFGGFKHKIGEIYPQLDISVVPSLREPCARVIIESMAFGKPVIATNVGGSLDLMTDQTGIFVPVDDPKALADAILYLLDNPSVRINMGVAGRKRVENFFTIERVMEKLYDVYENLL